MASETTLKDTSQIKMITALDGRKVFETTETTYITEAYQWDKSPIIKVTKTESTNSPTSHTMAKTTLTGLTESGSGDFQTLWTLEDSSHRAKYLDGFLVTEEERISDNLHRFYKPTDGQLLLRALGKRYFQVYIPGTFSTLKRWIVVLDETKPDIKLGNNRKVNVATFGYLDLHLNPLAKAFVWVTLPKSHGAGIHNLNIFDLEAKKTMYQDNIFLPLNRESCNEDPKTAFHRLGIQFEILGAQKPYKTLIPILHDTLSTPIGSSLQVDIVKP